MNNFESQFYKNKHPFKKGISRQPNLKVPDGVGFRSIHKNGQPIGARLLGLVVNVLSHLFGRGKAI